MMETIINHVDRKKSTIRIIYKFAHALVWLIFLGWSSKINSVCIAKHIYIQRSGDNHNNTPKTQDFLGAVTFRERAAWLFGFSNVKEWFSTKFHTSSLLNPGQLQAKMIFTRFYHRTSALKAAKWHEKDYICCLPVLKLWKDCKEKEASPESYNYLLAILESSKNQTSQQSDSSILCSASIVVPKLPLPIEVYNFVGCIRDPSFHPSSYIPCSFSLLLLSTSTFIKNYMLHQG